MQKFTFYLVLASLWMGCNMTDSADPVVISAIQAELQIDLASPFAAPSQFAFRLSTIEEKCAHARILADGAIQGLNLHIAVSGLLPGPACAGEYAYIQKDVYMDIIPGVYDFSLSIGEDIFNTGILNFDGDAYSLEMISSIGIKIGHTTLFKIPDGAIWGSISGNQNISAVEDEFASALHPITTNLQLRDGYYGHFTIQDSEVQNLAMTDDVVLDLNSAFIYLLDSDLDALQLVFDDFRARYGDNISISCTTWKGDSL